MRTLAKYLGRGAGALADEATELAKKKENPIADLTSLSFDNGTSFGAGPVVTLPTATHDALGSRKWSLSVRLQFLFPPDG